MTTVSLPAPAAMAFAQGRTLHLVRRAAPPRRRARRAKGAACGAVVVLVVVLVGAVW